MTQNEINDLASHTIDRCYKAIGQTADLIDDTHDQWLVMLTVFGSLFEAFAAMVADADDRIAKMPPPLRMFTVFQIMMRASGVGPSSINIRNVQALSDMAAVVHSYPEGILANVQRHR